MAALHVSLLISIPHATCRHHRNQSLKGRITDISASQPSTSSCSSNAGASSCSLWRSGWPAEHDLRPPSCGSSGGFRGALGAQGLRVAAARQARVFRRGELAARCALADGNGSGNGSMSDNGQPQPAGDSPPPEKRAILESRRDMLQEYVKSVQPEFMEKFVKRAPEQVVQAMRQTVTNMLGTLPPQFFEINVTTVAENLAQLMYSVMMTGYMFRNAQYRVELQQSISQVALRDPAAKDSLYEPSVNKGKVAGEVLRWHKEDGIEQVPAVEYIEMLESEILELRRQLDSSRRASRGRNELLEYIKSLQPQNLQELTSTAGEDALEAMNTFVTRLLGVKDPTQLKRAATETSAAELAKLLYWLMVVGYSIRNIEVRYDMERILGMPVSQKLAELPPGEEV